MAPESDLPQLPNGSTSWWMSFVAFLLSKLERVCGFIEPLGSVAAIASILKVTAESRGTQSNTPIRGLPDRVLNQADFFDRAKRAIRDAQRANAPCALIVVAQTGELRASVGVAYVRAGDDVHALLSRGLKELGPGSAPSTFVAPESGGSEYFEILVAGLLDKSSKKGDLVGRLDFGGFGWLLAGASAKTVDERADDVHAELVRVFAAPQQGVTKGVAASPQRYLPERILRRAEFPEKVESLLDGCRSVKVPLAVVLVTLRSNGESLVDGVGVALAEEDESVAQIFERAREAMRVDLPEALRVDAGESEETDDRRTRIVDALLACASKTDLVGHFGRAVFGLAIPGADLEAAKLRAHELRIALRQVSSSERVTS